MPDYTNPTAPLGPTTNIKTAEAKWYANGALGLLEQDLVLANLTYRDSSIDFKGSIGQAVNIKRPTRSMGSFDITPSPGANALLSGDTNRKTRADAVTRTGFVPDHIEETYIQVKLDTNRGSEHYISDEQLDFDIDTFAAEVLQPQTRGMAEYFDWRIAKDMMTFWGPNATPANERVVSVKANLVDPTDLTFEQQMHGDALAVRTAIIDARKAANAMAMPANGRYLLCTPEVEAILLKDPDFQRVDYTGTSAAMREAVVGTLYGLTIVTSNELANHTTDGLAMFLMHPTAFILVTHAPAIPKGAAFGSGASSNGVALRWMMDYDPAKLQDRSFLNTYLGTNTVAEDPRYVADMKARLPKTAKGATIPTAFDIMRVVRIDLVPSP